MLDKILDVKLWNKAKKEAEKHFSKPSAYKSGFITKYYKDHGGKFKGKPKMEGLKRWFAENWTNQRGTVGYKKPGDVYRPTKRITAKTPKTWSELTPSQIKRAKNKKKAVGRVNKF
jgi:hypothetical protein